MTARPCPCGLPGGYDACSGPYHRGEANPPTAERLMRSRYSAFAVGDAAYLLASWHPTTRPATLVLDPQTRWTGLEVLSARGGLLDADGEVAFRASHTRGVVEERSRFARDGGRWSYVGAADC